MQLVEKYRPASFDEIVGQESIVKILRRLIQKPDTFPNLMFSGPPGVGKTAVAICLAKELFGEYWQMNIKDLNASDDRGIDIVRNTIKNYVQVVPTNAPFKLVFLDEADSMTKDAQFALRRVLEDYSETSRFILSCNHPNKIIEPIRSRCAELHFKPLTNEHVVKYVGRILEAEKVSAEQAVLDTLAEKARGNLRWAVNQLQLLIPLSNNGVIYESSLQEIFTKDVRERTKQLFELLVRDPLTDRKLGAIDKFVVDMFYDGVSWEEVLEEFNHLVIRSKLVEECKVRLLLELGTTTYRISVGANAMLVLRSFLYQAECAIRVGV